VGKGKDGMDLYLHLGCSVALWCWIFFLGAVCTSPEAGTNE
jgi:hypothetical protein